MRGASGVKSFINGERHVILDRIVENSSRSQVRDSAPNGISSPRKQLAGCEGASAIRVRIEVNQRRLGGVKSVSRNDKVSSCLQNVGRRRRRVHKELKRRQRVERIAKRADSNPELVLPSRCCGYSEHEFSVRVDSNSSRVNLSLPNPNLDSSAC